MARHLVRARQGVDYDEHVLQAHGVESSLGGEDERGLTECERFPQAGQKEDWRLAMVLLGGRQGRSLAQTQRLNPNRLNHNLIIMWSRWGHVRMHVGGCCFWAMDLVWLHEQFDVRI